MVEAQKFRSDLFYRLNVVPVQVPPLRERQDDNPRLVRHFAPGSSRPRNKTIETIPSDAMTLLTRYRWPGNIRELQNLMERAVILSPGPILQVPLAGLQNRPSRGTAPKIDTLKDAERRHITDALEATHWVVGGPRGAAALLGMKRTTLQWRMD